jgi:hypothetical protein
MGKMGEMGFEMRVHVQPIGSNQTDRACVCVCVCVCVVWHQLLHSVIHNCASNIIGIMPHLLLFSSSGHPIRLGLRANDGRVVGHVHEEE